MRRRRKQTITRSFESLNELKQQGYQEITIENYLGYPIRLLRNDNTIDDTIVIGTHVLIESQPYFHSATIRLEAHAAGAWSTLILATYNLIKDHANTTST